MNLPRPTPRLMTLTSVLNKSLRNSSSRRGYSSSGSGTSSTVAPPPPAAPTPKPVPPPPPSSQSSSGGGGKLLTSVLLLGGAGAGVGAYYYYDPNAEVFKMARGALGMGNNNLNPATNCEPQATTTPKKAETTTKPKQTSSVPVPAPPEPKKPTTTAPMQKKEPVVKEQTPKKTVLPPPTPVPVAATAASAMAATAAVVPTQQPEPKKTAAAPTTSSESECKEKPKEEAVKKEPGDTVPKSVLVAALRAQQEAITESYEQRIKVIEGEFNRKIGNASQVAEAQRFVELKAKYNKASAALAAIEKGIEGRQEQNTRAKRLRALWAKVNGVHARVNHPEYHSSKVTKIDKAGLLSSIEVPDKFVSQMVNSLPSEPVHSLESLKDRFYSQVEPVCKSVGLIKEGEGFSLWKYMLGKVALAGVAAEATQLKSSSESPVRSTHQVLNTARKALEQSDLLSAAVAINNLTGLPREVASDWLSDARTLLETNQTLFVLMTYAASNNVF